MSAMTLPGDLTGASWDKQMAAVAKDKAVAAKLDGGKVAEALKKLSGANAGLNLDSLKFASATTAKQIDEAIEEFDALVKGAMKDVGAGTKQCAQAAKAFTDTARSLKLPGDSGKLVAASLAAATAVSNAAATFDRDFAKVIDAARADLAARLKQATEKEKKAGAAAPAAGGKPVESKAGKLVRTRALECFRKIKKPQPGARPFRFVVVAGKVSVTAYFGPIASTAQEKLLKSLIAEEKPFKTYKDPKGEVIWEKNAVTLVSDRLPAGVAKKLQVWLKKTTKLNVKIRVRKSNGEVDESLEGEDISDDKLKPDAADAADAEAKKQAGREFASRLSGMQARIKAALGGPLMEDIKELVTSITKAGNDKDFEEADAQLDEMDILLAESAKAEKAMPKLSIPTVAKATMAWGGARTKAIAEIGRLATEIDAAFEGEAAQKAKVTEAVARIKALIPKLDVTLETQLASAMKEKDPAKQKLLITRARLTLDSVSKLLDEDELMANLDNNEIMPSMKVVEPMRDRLAEVEAALG